VAGASSPSIFFGFPQFSEQENERKDANGTGGKWHYPCSGSNMMDVALSIFALVAGGVTVELIAAARAPLGYQDERGFHLGVETGQKPEDFQSGNPS